MIKFVNGFMKTTKYILTLALTICCALGNLYAITSSYYNSINNTSGTDLRNALYTITAVGPANGHNYNNLWNAYKTTDVYPAGHVNAGKIWDMYSDCLFTAGSDQCGNYSNVCDCYNREHSLPKSWFGEANPAYYDMGHIVPTDGKVNGMRSNNAFGEVKAGAATWGNGKLGGAKSITVTNVKGSSTITTTYSATVFEPADEYKGDFARMYMYMAVRYKPGNSNNVNLAKSGEGQDMFNSTDANYGLTDYSIALLMKWHRQDPVSQKEIDRNNGMQTVQNNRNPFIDYPCLAEYLWGNKAGETVTLSELVGTFAGSWTTGDGCPCGDVPAITLPTGDIFVGSTEAGTPITKNITVQGVNLEANLTLAVSGANSSLFSLNATSIQKTYAEAGTTVNITYTPTSAGNHSAVLTISGGGLSSNRTFNLTGTCCNPYTVTYSRNGITEQVGACGTYTLPTAENEEDACDGWEFQGWVTSSTPFSEGQTSAPTFVTEVSSATTLYAVYGKAEASSAPRRATMADTWTRVTSMATLTGGGTFIMGYEATAKSGTIIPLRSKDCNATTSGNGYFNTGTTAGSSTSGTLDMTGTITSTDYEVYITSPASGKINIQMVNSSGNYYGATSGGTTSNKGRLYTSGNSNETNLTVEWDNESNNTFKLTAGVSGSYKYLKYNTSNPRFAFYNSAGGQVVFYKKSSGGTTTTTYKKSPCTTYTISYADAGGVATGGTYSANVATALAGTTITLDYDEAEGYEFAGWTVTNASTSATIAVTKGQFTMPEANVTVQANFNALCSKLSAPDVTATPGDGQITLTWEDVTDAVGYTVSIGAGVGYTTECGGEASIGTITAAAGTNTCVITGLTNGLAYTTYVVANGISSVCDSEADVDTTTPSAEIPTEVTVTFNANGGSGTMSDQTIPYNTATALDANAFTRTGYTFQGWATEQSGAKEYNDGASVTLTEDITLYAVWQINSHNITFTQPTSGGTFTVHSSSSSPVSNVNYGSTVTIVVTPTNSHFTVNTVTVTGASGDVAVSGSGNTRTFIMPDEDVTVAVTMTEDPKYIVNWYVSGTPTAETKYAGETLAGIGTPSIECNDKVFQGWTSHNDYDSDDAPDDLFTSVADMTMPIGGANYYAVFATVEESEPAPTNNYQKITSTSELTTGNYLIVGYNNGYNAMSTTWKDKYYLDSKTVTPSNDVINTTDGAIIWNITVSNDQVSIHNETEGYLYIVQSGSYYNIKLGDNTINNKFTYSVNEGNWLFTSVTYPSRVLEYYTKNTRWAYYTAADAPVYLYKQQSSEGSTTISGYTTSCAAPENVTVTFNANDGNDVPATATQTIPYNEETALDANTFSRTGYHFTGWNTATDGSGAAYTDEAEVTLTKDLTLYAQWAKNSYNVIFTPSITGQATITVNGASTSPQTVAFESEVTIAVTPDPAYAADEVSVVDGEDEPVSVTNNGDGTYTFTMPASAVTVTVTLTAQPLYTIRFIDNGAVISTQEVFDGQSAVKPLPDPTPCEGYAFAGWWDAPLTTPTTTAETWITDFTASANQDYYAVYSYSEEGEGAPRRAKMEDEEYTLYSGALAEGDYIIYYDGKAMKATVTSGRLDYAEITPVNDKITSPDVSIVWHIAANGDYWTIYNADVENYAAGTGVKNKAQLLADGTDDKALWTASGTETYDFVNKANAAAEVNATLRENGTYGYACYAAGTGGSLSLYKKSSSGGGGGGTTTTTYYTTAPDCEPEITPTDMMIVAEYGGARIALTHNNDYTTFGATPMMFVGGKYYYPDSESAAEPVIADMTWQVTEMDGEGYTIKAGEQYLAPDDKGAITLSDEPYPWPMNEDGAISYDAVHQTFVVGGEGSLLPKIHTVPVPKADDIQLTSLHSDRTLTPKRFGTLCLPHAVALPFAWGVKVYSVAGAARDDSGNLKGIYLEEEIEMLEAGKPYLIEPVDEKNTSTMQMWYAKGMDYVTEPVDAIAMVGNLSTEPLTVERGYYVLSQNQLRKVAIDNQTIGQYKAYFDLNDLEDPAASPQAHAYRVMYVEGGEQVVTDLSQTPAAINWDEPVYNILGMRVDRNATGVLIQGGVKFIIRVP